LQEQIVDAIRNSTPEQRAERLRQVAREPHPPSIQPGLTESRP
jgi:hypothetical protein